MEVYINCCMLEKILENFHSRDIFRNVLDRSDCKISKSTISLEQIYENVWFFACWYKFIEIKSWLQNNGMEMVINGCSLSGWRNLTLAMSHKEINGINWFSLFLYKFRKAWSYFNSWTPKGSYKIMVVFLSFCLFIHLSNQHFSQAWRIIFFWIFGTMVDNCNI